MFPVRGLLTFALIVFICLAGSSSLRAQGFVEHVEPPVLQRGKTTRVTLVGSELGKAVGLWTGLPTGAVKAILAKPDSADLAVFEVTVAPDAPPGICGVRLATEDGLSNACLMLIDDLPVQAAPSEKAKAVKLPVALWGRCRQAEVDRFAIDVSAGQRV